MCMSLSREILKFKKERYKNEDVPLLDVIMDYAFENDLNLDILGKELVEDEVFVEALEHNLRRFGYLRDNKKQPSQIW